ncbi:MAG: hypothetical protein V4525_15790 [Pseudomonadota bacterium]
MNNTSSSPSSRSQPSPSTVFEGVMLSPIIAEHIEKKPVLWLPESLENPFRFVIEEQGTWYDPSLNCYLKWIHPGDHVLDIGSDPGIYAVAAALKAGAQGQVESIRLDALAQESLSLSCQELPQLHSRLGDLTTEARIPNIDIIRVGAAAIDAEGGWLARHPEILENRPWLYFSIRNSEAWDTKHLEQLQLSAYQLGRYIPFIDALVPYDWSCITQYEPYCANLFAVPKEHLNSWIEQGRWVEPKPLDRVPSPIVVAEQLKLWSPAYRELAEDYRDHAHPDTDMEELALGLAVQALNNASGASMTDRLSDWQWSIQLLLLLIEKAPTVSRLLTLSRLLFEAGERAQALKHLETIHAYFEANHTILSHLFLSPDKEWDNHAPSESLDFATWLYSAVLDTWVKQRHLSAYTLDSEGEAVWQYLLDQNTLPESSVQAFALHKKRLAEQRL